VDLAPELFLEWVRDVPVQLPAWPDQPRFLADHAARPVVAGDTVLLTCSRTDSLAGLHTGSGEERWRFRASGPIRLAPAVWEDRAFVASDDGYLYCLEIATGRLLWKFRGGPSDRKILGNGRLISTWPARGAPVVAPEPTRSGEPPRATVYFAAGIWPFMGIFIHALDASTGAVRWTNDGDGSMFIKQPHMADAFAGVAPQGSLVVQGDKLLVPGGRSVPACYDRRTGKLLHYRLAENSKTGGGPEVQAGGDVFANGGSVYLLETGEFVARLGEPLVMRKDRLWVASANQLREFDTRQASPMLASAAERKANPGALLTWTPQPTGSASVGRVTALLKVGSRLYGAGPGQVFAVDVPMAGDRVAPSWRAAVEGQPVHLAAGDGRLFVSTREGQLFCFGAERTVPHSVPLTPSPVEPSPEWAARTRELLETTGVREGWAVVWGAGTGRLALELVRQSNLNVVVIEPDAERVLTLREEAQQAGLFGERFTVLPGSPDTVQLPPYFASLMTSEDAERAGLGLEGDSLRRLFQSLRPFGGVACLNLQVAVKEERSLEDVVRSALRDPNGELGLVKVRPTEAGLLVVRDGPLPGSGNWTHEHADASNTRVSLDRVVKAPLGLLWFGGLSHDGILPRHGHGPQPQVIDGRLLIEGVDLLRAVDIYTGRLLWEARLPGLGKAYDNLAHQPGANAVGTNFVSLADGIYVAHDRACVCLDPATGREVRRFPLPIPRGEKKPPVWSYVNVVGDYLIAGTNPEAKETGKYRGSPSSRFLHVLDRRTGKLLWSAEAQNGGFRHNGICAGGQRLYTIDRPVPDSSVWSKSKIPLVASKGDARIVAFDLAGGRRLWQANKDVFGTWLSYSAEHDVLIESGRVARDTLGDEPKGIRAYRANRGAVLWFDERYSGPAMIHGDRILHGTGACDLLTGKPFTVPDPLTGEPVEWTWTRTYGCNTPMASVNLLTFRSGAAGYYDLCNLGGTGNFGGFRSGCTNNLVVAGGLVTVPDYTRTCTCSYQNQTSLALVPLADAEMWTYQGGSREIKGTIRRLGINLAAPGNRKADNGTLWIEYPFAGPGPRPVIQTVPEKPDWFRRHTSQVHTDGPAWVGASGARNLRQLTVRLAEEGMPERSCTVRLFFLEPDGRGTGERLFSVRLQNETALKSLDVSEEAGGPGRVLVKEFTGVRVGRELTVALTPLPGSPIQAPVLCGIEIVSAP
jgi:outer membrane protein assembly factor BamB